MRKTGSAAVILVSLLSVAACGGRQSAASSAGKACAADDIKVEGAFGADSTVTIPDTCTPPKELLTKDLVPGTGPAVKLGDSVDTYYHLVTWSDKKVLDSSWLHPPLAPFPVAPVGQADVIQGWNEALVGQQQGGRRLMIIPPEKGYGEGGHGIKPNETLVFVVDALKVTSAG
jgi:peptidylprolyl isomerase